MNTTNVEEEFSIKSLFVPFTSTKAIAFLILIGFIVYFNSLFNGFVWDDKTYIINNVGVHTVNLVEAFKGNFFNQGGQYRPIPVVYFSILYSLFNTLPLFYHLIQISFHIINAILVFILFKTFFKRQLAFFLSLLFLLHPLQVESVSYIGATGNNLFFLFGISALLLAIKVQSKGKQILIALFGLLLLSLLSKETGGLFLMMVLIYSFIYKQRKFMQYLLYSLLTIGIYFLIRLSIGQIFFEKSNLVAIARLSFHERLLNIPSVIFYYIQNFIYPNRITVGQEWIVTHITVSNFYFPLLLEITFFLATLLYISYLFKTSKERGKVLFYYCLWFFIGLFFHSQIFPLDWTVADRWFYFPSVGLIGMLGIVLQGIKINTKTSAYIVYGFMAIIIIALSIRTIVRNSNWADAITLYSHDTKITPSWDLENNLGYEYKYIDNQPEALKHYLKAIELFPFESTYLNAGIVFGNMGNHKKAIEYYFKALNANHYPSSSHKHNINTYTSLINALLISNQTILAKKVTLDALKDYPNAPELWGLLAIIQQWMGEDANALNSATKANSLKSTQFTNYIYNKIINNQKIKIYPDKNVIRYL